MGPFIGQSSEFLLCWLISRKMQMKLTASATKLSVMGSLGQGAKRARRPCPLSARAFVRVVT